LSRGDRGASVNGLQEALNRHGFALHTDGIFGPATETAVSGFQTAHRLAVDGIVGPDTWQSLDNAPVDSTLILRPDGLAIADFGDPADTAAAALQDVLGAPTKDRTGTMNYPCGDDWCEGKERIVEWSRPDGQGGFRVRFEQTDGPLTFVGWEHAGHSGAIGLALATAEGIAIDSTTSELAVAHPEMQFGFYPENGCGDAWWNPGEFRHCPGVVEEPRVDRVQNRIPVTAALVIARQVHRQPDLLLVDL